MIRHQGKDYPVTAAWAAENNVNGYDVMDRKELERCRQKLLELSNERRLDDVEQRNLASITHQINARNGIDWLGDRSLAELGFQGVDQVHGQSSTLECGCVLHHIYDHHKRHDADLVVHPHHGHKLCADHHKRHRHLNLIDLHAQLFPRG